jgi:hypothetical protein
MPAPAPGPPIRPPASGWTSFVADPDDPRPRILAEDGNPVHRLRFDHNRDTLLVHLGDEDGKGWTVMAVDRATRRWAFAQISWRPRSQTARASGTSHTTPSGGSVTSAEQGWLCHGTGSAFTPPRLPVSVPP